MKIKLIWFIVSFILIVVLYLGISGRMVEVNTDITVDGLDNETTKILYYAGLAPSSHNAQMWKVTIYPSEGRLVVGLDDNRTLPAADFENREALISMGAYARSCILAFEAYGYNTSHHISENGRAITINYTKNGMDKDEGLIALMKKRHTDKREYMPNDVPEFFQTGLHGIHGAVYFGRDGGEYEAIKHHTLEAAREQADNQAIRDELDKWLRLSNSEVINTKDGICAEHMGITGIKKSLYYTFISHDKARGDSFAAKGYEMAQKQADACAGFIVISSGENPVEYVNAGMRLMEVWLYAVRNNIEIQPMSYALENPGRRLALMMELKLPNPPQMVLRAGFVDGAYGENIPVRRDLKEYITVEK
ncbi:MAG: hypothetical protein K6C05_08885 [Anaerovibrio sp.]|uniref:hypothetical protein n=1 Tax=Anaerovibrio sp. TaxID=1872532 RepID=UPI0025E59E9D|nr:hypothetical protein [Anaerovibrio sp.]MCR5176946.1 hypothetical protein [Anaerovibrio sp.]